MKKSVGAIIYKDGKYLFVSRANITGKCFGLEKYIKSK